MPDLDVKQQELSAELIARSGFETEDLDLDACRQLYMSIVELAVQDYRFLHRMRKQDKPSRYDRKKKRQMIEDGDPADFFKSRWFEEVCNYIGIQADLIRERLDFEDEELEVKVA